MRRELLLRVATGIRALLLGGAAVTAVHGPVVVVIALAAASAMLASTYRPLLIAIMPWLVRSPAELSAVNVLATTMENSGALAGPVAAALLAAGPTWLAVGVASGFLAAAALLLWPVRLYQQHPDPGHARGSLLADTVRGLAEMARVAPPAGMAVLRQRRRHPHRRRPPRIPHRQGRLPQRTRIGCLERLSPLRTGRSVHAVSSDTRRRETRIFGDLISYRKGRKGCTRALIGSSEP